MKEELQNAFGKVFITISVDHENKWVHTDWKGYLTEENIKAGALAYTKAVENAGLCCVLNDTTQVIGSWDHSLDWVVNVWGPQAAKAGIKYFALITAPKTFAEESASNFYTTLKDFEVKLFDSEQDAQQWLRQILLTESNV